jgi:hypothetical protein
MLFPMLGLGDEELDALVEEATVDAYGDEEPLGGWPVNEHVAAERLSLVPV